MSGTRKRELEEEENKEITKCCMAFETKDQICIYLYHGNPDNKPVTLTIVNAEVGRIKADNSENTSSSSSTTLASNSTAKRRAIKSSVLLSESGTDNKSIISSGVSVKSESNKSESNSSKDVVARPSHINKKYGSVFHTDACVRNIITLPDPFVSFKLLSMPEWLEIEQTFKSSLSGNMQLQPRVLHNITHSGEGPSNHDISCMKEKSGKVTI